MRKVDFCSFLVALRANLSVMMLVFAALRSRLFALVARNGFHPTRTSFDPPCLSSSWLFRCLFTGANIFFIIPGSLDVSFGSWHLEMS